MGILAPGEQMEIRIRAKGLPGAAAVRQFAAHTVGGMLQPFGEVVGSVEVQLTDSNGPDRGGIDKLCRAVIRLRDNSLFVVEELGTDVRRVIERTALRIRDGLAEQGKRRGRGLHVIVSA